MTCTSHGRPARGRRVGLARGDPVGYLVALNLWPRQRARLRGRRRLILIALETTVDEASSYDGITLRLLSWEHSAIEGACAALNGLERSILMQEAVLAETNRLGIRWSTRPPPPLAEPWPYKPIREAPSSDVRMQMSISITLAELVTRAAEYVGVSRPHFIIGSTMAHIGRLHDAFRRCASLRPRTRELSRT